MFGSTDFARTQKDFEKAMMQAQTMEERADLFLEMSSSSIFGYEGSGEDLVTDDEIDRFGELRLQAYSASLGNLRECEGRRDPTDQHEREAQNHCPIREHPQSLSGLAGSGEAARVRRSSTRHGARSSRAGLIWCSFRLRRPVRAGDRSIFFWSLMCRNRISLSSGIFRWRKRS